MCRGADNAKYSVEIGAISVERFFNCLEAEIAFYNFVAEKFLQTTYNMKNHFTQKLFASAVMLSAVAFAASADIKIGETSYTNLNAAVRAVQDGETILISGSVDCTWTFNPVANLNFTIEGVGEDATINIKRRDDNTFRLFFNLKQANVGLTLKNLTISMVEVEGVTGADFDGNLIQQQSGTLTMENVIVKGFTSTTTRGAIRIQSNSVSTSFTGISFENCTTGNGSDVVVAKPDYNLVVGGTCNFTCQLNDNSSYLTADNLSSNSHIKLVLPSGMTGKTVVKGAENFEMFTVAANGTQYILGPQDGNIVALADNNVLLVQIVEGKTTSSTMANFPKAADFTTGDNIRILLYKDVKFTSSVSFAGKTIEIAGAKDGVTLTRNTDRYVVNGTTKNTHVTVKNLTLSQSADYQYADYQNNFVILDKATSSVALHNVAFKNNNVNGALVAQSAGDLVLDGVTFDNCTSSAGALVTVGAPGNVTLSGLNEGLSIAPTFNTPINCEGIQKPENLITVVISEDFINSIPVDTDDESKKLPVIFTNFNHTDPYDYFTISNTNYTLDYTDGGKNLILITKTASGVEEIEGEEAADVAPVYYDVNGVMVPSDALTPGLYICVKGDKASKVVIR